VAGITISDEAAQKIHGLLDSMSKPDHGLRLKLVRRGCSGLQYKLDVDSPRDGV
jgi:Fe-S cluster assembly iron-binding protein IscA